MEMIRVPKRRLWSHRRRSGHLCNDRQGLLLVEVLVSFFIFAVAVFSLYGLLGASRTADSKARAVVAATRLAEELLETLDAGQSALQLGRSEGQRVTALTRDGHESLLKLNYVLEIQAGPAPGVYSALVVVTAEGLPGAVEMEQYVVR